MNRLKEKGNWIKISKNLHINDIEKKVQINKNKYNFSDILDCELIKEEGTYNGNSVLRKRYIKITLNDFNNPIITMNFNISEKEAQKSISALKLVISKNNERKY